MELAYQSSVVTESKNQINKLELFREVYQKVTWKPYENLFESMRCLSELNYNFYDCLGKGEQNIVKMHLTDHFKEGVKPNDLNHNKSYAMCYETIDFTLCTKDSRKNAKRKMITLSNERNNELKRLAIQIYQEGIRRPEYRVDIYNLDYDYLLKEINKVRFMEIEELKLILFVFDKLAKNNLFSMSRSFLTGLLTNHHYKGVIDVFIRAGIIKLHRKYRKYFHSNTYRVFLTKVNSVLISNNKTLQRLKNIELKYDRYSDEEKLEKLSASCLESPIFRDLQVMIQAKYYILKDANNNILDDDFKWLSDDVNKFGCMVYRYSPNIYFSDDLKVDKVTTQMVDIFAEYYYKNILEYIEKGSEYTAFNENKNFSDYMMELPSQGA